MEDTNLEVHRTRKMSLAQLLITAAVFFTLLIILINSGWSNFNLASGAIMLVMLVSIAVGVWKTSGSFVEAIRKGADTDFRER